MRIRYDTPIDGLNSKECYEEDRSNLLVNMLSLHEEGVLGCLAFELKICREGAGAWPEDQMGSLFNCPSFPEFRPSLIEA